MATGRLPDPNSSPLTAKGDLYTYSTVPAKLAVGSNGETLVADSSQSTGLRWGSNYGFTAGKNFLINGDFRINQRSFTSRTTDGYGFDRWSFIWGGATSATYSAQTFTPGSAPVSGYEGINFARLATTTANAANEYSVLQQKIEDVRTVAGRTVTVSFWAKAASGTPKVGVEFYQAFGSGGSADTSSGGTAVTISTSWARYSVTINIPSISGKTVGTGSLTELNLWCSAGSTFASRSGSVGNQTATIDFWGVQVEQGSVATAFQTATGTLAGELAAAQRYYWRFTGPNVYSSYGQGYLEGALGGNIDMPYPVTMRTVPTVCDFGNVAFQDSAGTVLPITNLTINQSSLKDGSLNFTIASGGTAHRPGRFINNNNAAGFVGIGAEL